METLANWTYKGSPTLRRRKTGNTIPESKGFDILTRLTLPSPSRSLFKTV